MVLIWGLGVFAFKFRECVQCREGLILLNFGVIGVFGGAQPTGHGRA